MHFVQIFRSNDLHPNTLIKMTDKGTCDLERENILFAGHQEMQLKMALILKRLCKRAIKQKFFCLGCQCEAVS